MYVTMMLIHIQEYRPASCTPSGCMSAPKQLDWSYIQACRSAGRRMAYILTGVCRVPKRTLAVSAPHRALSVCPARAERLGTHLCHSASPRRQTTPQQISDDPDIEAFRSHKRTSTFHDEDAESVHTGLDQGFDDESVSFVRWRSTTLSSIDEFDGVDLSAHEQHNFDSPRSMLTIRNQVRCPAEHDLAQHGS